MTASKGAEWAGPTVKEMIESHTLAHEIITRHNDLCPVLDPSELRILRQFILDPISHDKILRDHDMMDTPGDTTIGNAAQKKGSLAGFIVAHHSASSGSGVEPALTEEEMERLKVWFESGAADDRVLQEE